LVAASSDARASGRKKVGCRTLGLFKGAVFLGVALFGAVRGWSESIDDTNLVAGPKTRTLEKPKGAAPATHNQIPFQIFHPIC
jgi:hypothetical protein